MLAAKLKARTLGVIGVVGAVLGVGFLLSGAPLGVPVASPAEPASTPGSCSLTRQLAYVEAEYSGQKGTVWLAQANGSERQRLVEGATPAIAPNGGLIAVTQPGGSNGLEIVNACGGVLGKYFSSKDAVSGVTWSPDSSLVAAVVDPHPNGQVFSQQLEIINVATGHLTSVAKGFLNGFGRPSFSPTAPYSVVYALVPKVDTPTNIWSDAIGEPAKQLTHKGENEYPLWGSRGILYEHIAASSSTELELISPSQKTTRLMKLEGWPVALSSNGLHLAAEGAACGVVWPLSVNLATRKVVHQFANGYAPFGISGSGGSLLISGSKPGDECSGTRSAIETVPFAGGKPTKVAYGTDPSWVPNTE